MGTGELLGKPNKLWGSDLRWTSLPSRGSRSNPSSFMLQKPGLAPAAMSYLARAPRLHFYCTVHVATQGGTVTCG